MPGISINRAGKTLMTGPSQRVIDLSNVPSPYTMGLFDKLPEMYPGKIWNAIIGLIGVFLLCALFVTGEELLFKG